MPTLGKFNAETLTLASEWSRTYGGPAPIAQLARFCRPLFERYPLEQIRYHFRNYLAAHSNGKAVYASPAKFAQTFNQWAPPTHSVVRVPYQRTPDECDRAAGIKLPGEP